MASLFPSVSNAVDRVIPGKDSKEIAAKMDAQSSSLKSITKILVRNNEDLRKDVTDLKKEFILGTAEFSRMRQYFERLDNAKPAEKVKETKENSFLYLFIITNRVLFFFYFSKNFTNHFAFYLSAKRSKVIYYTFKCIWIYSLYIINTINLEIFGLCRIGY